ncbi:MAG: cytochrome P450 [Actinobacteria bacterium]|nr:cytochrome P450 [Actinomycetota bacterium]
MTTVLDAAGQFSDWDPLAQYPIDPPGARDPYPRLAECRRSKPIATRNARDEHGNIVDAFEVYRYDDVAAVMRDNTTFSSESIRADMAPVMGEHVLVGMDEPDHKRLRSLVQFPFRPKSIAHWEDELVRPVVDGMIDRFVDRGHAELVQEFTYTYPVQVIAVILGLPHEDHLQFHQWANAITNFAANPKTGFIAARELRAYFADVVEDRRKHPRDDIVTEIAVAEIDGERISDEETFSFLQLLLPAGAETTYRATGNFLFGLLSNPDQLDAIRADRSLMTQAVEESIRWGPPLLITSRIATKDTEIAGTPVPAGSQVIANVGSANRDETRWERADEFDIFRESVPMISFGVGVHMCLGMHLARMEMRTAVNRLLDRCPSLRFDAEAIERDDVHIHGETFRSPTAIPVLFNPSGSPPQAPAPTALGRQSHTERLASVT